MNDKTANHYQHNSLSSLTDSGFLSRLTTLSNNHFDNDFTIENPNPSIEINKPILSYKKCSEYTQYSNCLITYLDHPSAIFIQILDDVLSFQQMHQNLNRYYMNNYHLRTIHNNFQIGDFCVAYSRQYFEFFRARILSIDRENEKYLIIYVDFGNSEWLHSKYLRLLINEFTHLQIQAIAVTLSHIIPKKDRHTNITQWNTSIGNECTQTLRRLLIKSNHEPLLFVCITFLSNKNWWPLPFVDIKLDGQDLAEILHHDGLAYLTKNQDDLKMIYPNFGLHTHEKLVFGI